MSSTSHFQRNQYSIYTFLDIPLQVIPTGGKYCTSCDPKGNSCYAWKLRNEEIGKAAKLCESIRCSRGDDSQELCIIKITYRIYLSESKLT